MKRLNIILSGMLLLGAGLTSCDNEQEIPPVTFPEGGSIETLGTGTWDDPYSVWQVLAGVEQMDRDYSYGWVHGYVVGYTNTDIANKLNEQTATFAIGGVQSNILLADSPDETDWENCIPVQLTWGMAAREAVALNRNNGASFHKEVCLYGLTGAKYQTVYGLRDCCYFKWGEKGYPISNGSDSDGSLSFLTSGLGEFTVENILKPDAINAIWEWGGNNYGAKATGYNANDKKNYDTEAYLVSPEIEITEARHTVTFSQAINYLRGHKISEYCSVEIREGKDGAWKQADVSEWPEGNNWTFVDGCQINVDEYIGKTIQIGFHFKSNTSNSCTWEVKNLLIQ
ncbi:MAG: choice-of-anchor J domain-containing protein [Muribaculaceae bacterium]|nr:choice-of-anchor J domain-containing protein [Muribaculaceae bacterium]